MAKSLYKLTDKATRELRLQAGASGVLLLSDRQAEYELLRGTIELATSPATAAKNAQPAS